MPLTPGCTREIVHSNIARLLSENYPQRQAVAIALAHARATGRGECRRRMDRNRPGRAGGRSPTIDDFASLVFRNLATRHGLSFDAAEALVNRHADLVMVDWEFSRISRTYSAEEISAETASAIVKRARTGKSKSRVAPTRRSRANV